MHPGPTKHCSAELFQFNVVNIEFVDFAVTRAWNS